MTKVIVGIPTFNGYYRVEWLLQSILMRTDNYIDYKIVIIDDSGNESHQEKTKSVIDRWSSILPVSLLINNSNSGVATSWNRIIDSEDSQYIILINDDVIVKEDWLKNMVYFLDNNPNAGAVYYNFVRTEEGDIPRLLYNDHKSKIDHLAPIRRMHYVGCFFGFDRKKYNMVGKFDENYFANVEETDFCTALASLGYPSYILRYPMCQHIWSATFKSSPEMNYLNILKESRQYYNKKWNGSIDAVTSRYMSKIPFQKVRWACNGDTHEEVLTDDYGYFQIQINNGDIKITI
jgi:GT2 family glycosyltransferase